MSSSEEEVSITCQLDFMGYILEFWVSSSQNLCPGYDDNTCSDVDLLPANGIPICICLISVAIVSYFLYINLGVTNFNCM